MPAMRLEESPVGWLLLACLTQPEAARLPGCHRRFSPPASQPWSGTKFAAGLDSKHFSWRRWIMWNPTAWQTFRSTKATSNKSSISPALRKRCSPHFKQIEVSSWFCWCEVLQNYSDTACHRKMKWVLMFQRALGRCGAMFTWCHDQTDKTAVPDNAAVQS